MILAVERDQAHILARLLQRVRHVLALIHTTVSTRPCTSGSHRHLVDMEIGESVPAPGRRRCSPREE